MDRSSDKNFDLEEAKKNFKRRKYRNQINEADDQTTFPQIRASRLREMKKNRNNL